MLKNYKKTNASGLLKSLVSLLVLGSSWLGLQAQLSGSYTINPGAAASSTNFTSLASFVTSLNTNGVSGKVTATFQANETTTQNVTFGVIKGVSSTNTVNIDGKGFKFSSSVAYIMGSTTTSASNSEVIRFTGTDYVNITNLVVENTNSAVNSRIVRFESSTTDACTYINLDACTFQFSAIASGSTAGGAYVVYGNSATSIFTNPSYVMAQNTVVSNCLMRTTNSNSPGPTYGILDCGSSSYFSSTVNGNTFKGNTIQNFYYYGIYLNYVNGETLEGNDLSRANATSNNAYSYLYGIYSYYSYGVQIVKNNVHDLPFKGATGTAGAYYVYGIYTYYNRPSSARSSFVNNNIVEKCLSYYYFYGIYSYYSYNHSVSNNKVRFNSNYLYYFYGIYSYYDQLIKLNSNQVDTNNNDGYYFYGMEIGYASGSANECNDNKIRFNKNNNSNSGYGLYGIDMYNYSGTANWKIERNLIWKNEALGYSYSSFYGMYIYYYVAADVSSNMVVENAMNGYDYCVYFYNPSASYPLRFYQNTIYMDNSRSSYYYRDHNGFYGGNYGSTSLIGNIIMLTNSYSCSQMYIYGSATGLTIDDNSYFDTNNLDNFWYNPNGSGANYGAWMGTNLPGKGEKFQNHRFKDIAKIDYRSQVFENQNNVKQTTWVVDDYSKSLRNKVKNDRGALENYMDAEVTKSDFSVPSSVCAGWESTNVNLYVKNNFIDTIYGFNVSYSINGKVTTQLVKDKILAGNTQKITFNVPMTLSIAGQTTIKIYLDIPDDNTKNDSLTFTTLVKPAPGGGFYEFSTKTTTPNTAVYQRGRPYDVTVLNQPVIYDVIAPRVYSNSSYGTSLPSNWYATVQAYTQAGKAVTGASLTAPNGATNLEVQFKTADATLEDSFVTVVLKVTDNNNGCDTFIKRKVLIYPSINADFKVPARICNGDAVLFENLSKVNSGGMEFFWNFGTGNAADTSNAPEPVFQYSGAGKYKATLTTKTVPFGFVFTKTIDVDVNAIPKVAFDKANACLGQDLVFTNKTNPLTAKMTWDFGNGATATTTDAKYKFGKAGTYLVSLSADLNGCVAKVTQKVYQFEKPVAKFALTSGTCDNDDFVFENQSTIGSGLMGTLWNFDDNGSVSTDVNPTYSFSKSGKKNVKLVASSEFGCTDSMIKVIEVRESPKTGFTNTPACSLNPTVFTNTTADVAGAVANYAWNFGDGSKSTTKSPSHSWSNLGPKKVTLLVTLDNGCKAEVSKDLSVLTQPKASFVASDVCAGDQVIFANNTTWPQGDITYTWDFGDNTYSTSSDPSKLYNIVQTTSYNVTLYAYIAGGCADSITQRVTINEAPRTCDFQSAPDYAHSFYGIRVEPVNASGVAGGQNNVDYTWIFATGGTLKSKDVNAAVSYDLQFDGEYEVTMKAVVRQTGCECSKTKKVIMNRAAVKDLQEVGVAVYPNPTSADIKVATSETFGANITVNVMSVEGKMVSSRTVANEGVMSLNTDGLSNGVYLVQVTSGSKQVTKKITVQK
jgi:parallel beta-helix repeat protein